MTDLNDIESLSNQWSKSIAINDWQGALDIAISGYHAANIAKDHALIMMFLGFVRLASERLFQQSSQHGKQNEPDAIRCSFCGNSEIGLPVVAGANVAICAECASSANARLNS
jgi:hypothetical protein